MKVEIDINSEVLNSLIEKELGYIKPDDVKDIALQCIHECLVSGNYEMIKSLLVKKRSGYWGNENVATEFTEKMLKSCDYSKLQDVVDLMVDTLKRDYKFLLKEILLETIVDGLMNKYAVSNSLKNVINGEIAASKAGV